MPPSSFHVDLPKAASKGMKRGGHFFFFHFISFVDFVLKILISGFPGIFDADTQKEEKRKETRKVNEENKERRNREQQEKEREVEEEHAQEEEEERTKILGKGQKRPDEFN
jgi:cell shape-determining protein MreC